MSTFAALKYKVDHGFASKVFWVSLEFIVSLVQLLSDVCVHLTTVPPLNVPSCNVHVLQGIDLSVRLMPPGLAQKLAA